MSLALVDTSVWISFFRGDPGAVARLDPLLAAGADFEPIAEVLSLRLERI